MRGRGVCQVWHHAGWVTPSSSSRLSVHASILAVTSVSGSTSPEASMSLIISLRWMYCSSRSLRRFKLKRGGLKNKVEIITRPLDVWIKKTRDERGFGGLGGRV